MHKLIHMRETPYTCKNCLRLFSMKSSLTRHKKYRHLQCHTEEKLFQCDSCDRICMDSTNLKVHKLIHSGEKPFKCPLCDKTFSRSSNVAQHKLINTGDKLYTCKDCLHSFSQKYDLSRHKKGQLQCRKKLVTCQEMA